MKRSSIKLFSCLVFFFIQNYAALAQDKNIDHHTQLWTQYFQTIKLDKKWSVNLDGGYRWIGSFDEKYQFLVRGGVSRTLSKKLTATGGYTYFLHYPNSHLGMTTRYEYRPWQQLVHTQKFKRFQLLSRIRTEQRWIKMAISEKTNFNHRFRFQMQVQIPITSTEIGKGVPYLILSEELMFNAGKDIVYNNFDQSRSLIGLGYGLTKSLNVAFAYQYIWLKRNAPETYNSIQSFRLSFIHQLDLSKKKEE